MQELGGAILTPESIASESAEKKMTGSVLFFHAETIDEVQKTVESDVYYTSNVVSRFHLTEVLLISDCGVQWDVEKIVIAPYAIAGGSQWP